MTGINDFIVIWRGFLCNAIALRKAKIVCNFGLSECSRVKKWVLAYSELLLNISLVGGQS